MQNNQLPTKTPIGLKTTLICSMQFKNLGKQNINGHWPPMSNVIWFYGPLEV